MRNVELVAKLKGYIPLGLDLYPPLGLADLLLSGIQKLLKGDKMLGGEKKAVMLSVSKLVEDFESHQRARDKETRKKFSVPAGLPLFTLLDSEKVLLSNFVVYLLMRYSTKVKEGRQSEENELKAEAHGL